MRNNNIKEAGLTGNGGICIAGDIGLKFSKYHSSTLYFAFRIMIAFLATFSTAVLADSFTNAGIRPLLLLYDCLITVLSVSLLFAKHKIIKICSGVVLFMYLAPTMINIKMVRYGFWVAANGYLTKGDLPEQTTGFFKHVLTTRAEIEQSLFYFFTALIFIIAIGCVISSVVRIDFPMLFVFTFPIFELGLYLGFDVPTYAALMMLVSWFTLLALNIINHTTNKAGRKNTFAVHERSKTFYFTSSEAKAEFYTVYIKFVALVTASVFLLVVLFSKISGFYRPESFNELRYNLHHAFERFNVTHADDFLIDVNGGSNLFGVTTVGGTNGGILGNTNGISFNGSKALIIDTERFNYTMYLRGYVAGDYDDNKWQPLENDSEMDEIKENFSEYGTWVQDYDCIMLNGIDEMSGSHNAKMNVIVKGACSKFVYAPYATDYSLSYDNIGEQSGMTPYNDSYVRISQSSKEYELEYKSFIDSNWNSRIRTLKSIGLDYFLPSSKTLSDYRDYVYKNYTDPADIDSLDKAYREIIDKYLGGEGGPYSYDEVYFGIKSYFNDHGFTYNTRPGKTPEGRDFIDYFLTEQRSGYCTYYATVGAQLMRKFGYPARYVEGYMILPSQLNTAEVSGGTYTVTVKDKCAHAWTEVFINGIGWMPAEFTPGYENDNPNLSKEEKGLNKPNDSSKDESSKSDSSRAIKDSSKTIRPPTTSKVQDESSEKPAGGNTESKDDSSSKKPKGGTPGGKKGGGDGEGSSPVAKSMCMTAIAVIIGAAAVVLNRRRCLNKMHESCEQKDISRRIMAMYTYSLKYLAVLDIEVKKNISDMQMCDELLQKCHEQRIHELDEKLADLTTLAVKAYMCPDSMTEDEALQAQEIFSFISDEVVAKKLNTLTMLSAKYLYCLY
ncbi:transglutaminase domain-containing protein [uncultured Ruminococcus sp.]|uniref:transglutaminase domain-containing protein n=1 Tax=uncultured Ruminococcus sp. TaxID=165186 RepID=UPI0025E13376|nr:transglutaminase domain-containing protein [uncultured Ruminococcus sp.]